MSFKPKQMRIAWLSLVLLIFFASCSVKRIVYFNDLPTDSTKILKEAAAFTEPIIQSDDIINVTIQTIDPQTSAIVNQMEVSKAVGVSSASNSGNQEISGFLVDREGYIQITLLGKIKVAGLTTFSAKERILHLAEQYYKNPSVQVRFANFKVSVLGEVNRKGVYYLPNEKVSVLDALALAGDLTTFGRRENILLIREKASEKELIRLDLNNSETLKSPYFYLRQNDVIYVEPNSARAAGNNASTIQIFTVITTFVSVLSLVLSRL